MSTAVLALARPPATGRACTRRRVGPPAWSPPPPWWHAALTPRHLNEGLLFGVAFVAMTATGGADA